MQSVLMLSLSTVRGAAYKRSRPLQQLRQGTSKGKHEIDVHAARRLSMLFHPLRDLNKIMSHVNRSRNFNSQRNCNVGSKLKKHSSMSANAMWDQK